MLEIWPFLNCLGLGIVLLFMAALWGGALISLCSEIQGWVSGNKFSDKFALQVCRMSLMGLLVLAALATLAAVLRFQTMPAGQPVLPDSAKTVWIWPLAGLGLGVVFQIVSLVTWRNLKRKIKAIHLLISVVAVLGLWMGGYGILNLGLGYLFGPGLETASGMPCWSVLLPIVPEILGPASISFLLLSLGGGGTMAGGYLLLRRNQDDFGRDYYTRVQPLAARWGMLFLLQFFFLVWIFWSGSDVPAQAAEHSILQRPEILGVGLGAGLCFVLQFFLMLAVSRSKTPLRKKGSMVFGLIFSWLALSLSAAFLYLVHDFGLNLFEKGIWQLLA